ncbi:hypothetical protein WMY93_006926 [Mugilogobius chulae]|uniref:Hemogen n=1 Tax=Mugilogobius chulae TaxID=88201 RepID=A0AAW0PNS7_9GOBI
MEESVQQEPQQEPFQEDQQEQPELEYKNDQGDFRRRLRDRDLLKKRKAEAEEKETDEWDFGTESPRKKGRSGGKRGRRRGRPRKTETAVISDLQRESGLDQDTPASLTEAVLGETPIPLEAQVSDATADAPAFVELNPTPQDPTTALEPAVDIPPSLVQDVTPSAAFALPSIAPAIPEPMYTEPQIKPPQDQILIEDLGPDEEEDLCPSQDQQAVEGFCTFLYLSDSNEKPTVSTAEVTFLSSPTLSSPSQQEYVPGNSF